ncbi:Protein CMS1 [Penicillium malachiteum]|uniref:Protein CMS1 n=1 Tax=Penicillium malachiteum TaxID=1324776 RepID=UPI00254704C2|nr:Protein CMS1 [Penicillium malachiteum]KAJ5726388.1 Protein CMS1 [Penicillium malachiteum]
MEKSKQTGLAGKLEKKRKRQIDESTKQDRSDASSNVAPANSTNGLNKKKRKKAKHSSGQPGQDVKMQDRKDGIDESIGKMDGRLLSDYFAQRAQKLNKELSAVELNDISVPDSAFFDTTAFTEPRTLERLPEFLKKFCPNGIDLSKSSEQKGTPHTLVITAAGLRAADIVRSLRPFQKKESIVGKLFAKHIKLDEAKQFLQRAQMGIGVGTPSRVSDLIESGDLKLNDLQRLVIDGSHIDQKQRGIFDMKDTHFPLLKLLTCPDLRERYGAGRTGMRILMF